MKHNMKGFFTSEKVKAAKGRNGCLACGLDRGCLSPRMAPTGAGLRGLLAIAEVPGETEDKRGEQLVGGAGMVLRLALAKRGIDLDRDCRKTNAVVCRPPKNRAPSDKEIEYCRPKVWEEIERFHPKVILLMGTAAIESFLGHRWPESLGGIARWRGYGIPDREARAWVVPTYHPSYLLRSKQPVLETIFGQDLDLAIRLLDTPFPDYKDEREEVRLIMNETELIYECQKILGLEDILVSFDFETSGLKPHADGHFIRCMSMCYRNDYSIAFPMPFGGSDAFAYLVRILRSRLIRKTAHRLQFETSWAREIMGVEVKNWWQCTKIGSHVLDNRQSSTGLKFQLYINFGTPDYSSHLSQFLEAGERRNANSFNRIQDAPLEELLVYCGVDSLGTYRLAIKQAERLGLYN